MPDGNTTYYEQCVDDFIGKLEAIRIDLRLDSDFRRKEIEHQIKQLNVWKRRFSKLRNIDHFKFLNGVAEIG